VRRMSAEEALAFLGDGRRTAHVATTRRDGSPHVVPVWYVVDGDAVVFTIARDSVKARNLTRDPRLTVSVDDNVFPYAFATVSGRADIADRPADFLDWTTRIARRYLGEEGAAEYGARNFELDDWVVRLRPERIFAAAEIAF
jgi:PPOX class probable F420-dependent enzyme